MTSYAFDVDDDRKLVGTADHVFIGRVLRKVGDEGQPTSDSEMDLEQTQFAVEVLENIKGNLSGIATVNQDGGYAEYRANKDYPEYGVRKGDRVRELILVDGDPLLKPGREYLLVTTFSSQRDWLQIGAPGFGDLPILDESHHLELVERFTRATRDQIDPFDPSEQLDKFDVVLVSIGDDRPGLIREVRKALGLGLKEARDLVDAAPCLLKEAVSRSEAEDLEVRLRSVGAEVNLQRWVSS